MSAKTRFCERCGVAIPAERVEALPDTRICVKCSEEIGGEYETRVVTSSLGKAGSLKKNYGDATLRKRRKIITRKKDA